MDKSIIKTIKVNLPKTYWVVFKLEKWNKIKLKSGNYKLPYPITFKPTNRGIGFLPVFDTKENALKYCSEEKYLFKIEEEIRIRDKDK
jgi:hypothetical protein